MTQRAALDKELLKRRFTYPIRSRFWTGIMIAIWTVAAVGGIAQILESFEVTQSGLLVSPGRLVVALVYTLGSIVGIFVSMNLEPNILITEEGIRVQKHIISSTHIPWDQILEIRQVILPISQSKLIVVKQLTFIHRIIGWMYGLTTKPCILVRKTMHGSKQAIAQIRSQIRDASESQDQMI